MAWLSDEMIENAGRRFYYGKADRARAGQMVVDAAAAIARPGQRLVVGPVELRRTAYSDAYLYHLLPSLEPGTRYIEMDPGVADRADSGLDREIAAADVDLVVFVGDYIYTTEVPSYNRVRRHPHRFPDRHERHTLADYRIHHASYKLDADLRACHAAHPWLLVWDDHEVLNGYADDWGDEERQGKAFMKVRTAAYRAYFEHMPLLPSRQPQGDSMRMHDHFQWGRLADLWLLDGRQFRTRPPCRGWHDLARGNALWRCPQVEDEARTVLGQEQEDWLAAGLAGSERAWKLVLQPTQMAPGIVPTPVGEVRYTDGWDAFPAARARLMSAIAQPRVQDVVLLGGDVHRHVAARLRLDPTDPQSPVVASEFVTSSITSKGLSEFVDMLVRRYNPDLLHMRSDERGYVRLDITPEQLQCTFRATAHPVKPGASLHTQSVWVVDRGQPGPRRQAR